MKPSVPIAAIALAALAASCASTQTAAAPPTSWGKANVTLVQYWSDAAQCTLAGAQAEVTRVIPDTSLTRNGNSFADPGVRRVSSDDESIISINDSILRARHNDLQQRRAEEAARRQIVDHCLTERGYSRFQLTSDQAATLATLPEGSRQRREFLHRLASDPAVLSNQGV